MLRYIFFKLSGFTSKKEFCISSSCNQMLMFRPSSSAKKEFHREGRKIGQSRSQHKRSYSFPSRSTKSCRLLDNETPWRKSEPSECPSFQPIRRKSSFHQNSSKISKETTKRANSVKSGKTFSTNLTKNTSQEKVDLKCKYEELSCLDNSERYELEVARPRRSKSELIFNVFDYVAKDVDLTDYLQPSNLRPFGSTDNIYLPLLMPHKNIDVVPQNNPNYLHTVSDVGTPERTTPKKVVAKETTDEVKKTPVNKLKKEFKGIGSYKDTNSRSKEIVPLFMSKRQDAVEAKPPYEVRGAASKSLRITTNREAEIDEDMASHRPKWSQSSITIEPPPFLTKKEENVYSSVSLGDVSVDTKRSITNFRQPVDTPWPAYSDHVKSMPKKMLVTYPTGTVMENVDGKPDPKPPRRLTRTLSMENVKVTVDKPKALKKEKRIRSNTPQRRTLSMEHVRSSMEPSQSLEDVPKGTKSSIYASNSLVRNSVTQSLVSLNAKGANLSPSQRYAKSYSKTRDFEPKTCKPPEKKKKYFLPSKVRLKPPPCITKKPCPVPPPCVRADDFLKEPIKKLPVLKDGDCKCFEPAFPNQNPTLKRLTMKFEDEPRCCPCIPVTPCPCPPPPRADDCQPPKVKKLVPYQPGECTCIEPPPMVDVPLVRLQKICIPEDRCYPPKPCVVVEPCEEKVRADDCVKKPFKPLRALEMGNCLCVNAYMPNVKPKIKRLDLQVEEPPRVCPCVEPCVCPEAPPSRADDCAPEKAKKLPSLKPKVCECIEPPRMVDVPLKRLVKKCMPGDICYPIRECPVEPCEEQIRADMFLVEKPKKLPKFRDSDCECFEPHMPDQAPKLKRLHMKFLDEPRCCPCIPPPVCPCPPPPRADDCQPPKVKTLPKLVAKECPCIEPPRMVDVPLVRLQKVCVPQYGGECYPKEPCVVETCEERERADDCLKEKPKKLRPLIPKPCPCVDFRMKEAPKMKRLILSAPDPPRICPVKICPPPDEVCPRADECSPQKYKKLRPIKPGDCPYIDRPMVDVPPIPRLKCIDEPEELLEKDPCVPYPRADWGCWEYLQDAEGVEKDKCKTPKDLNYKQKRGFNTDSRSSIAANNISHRKEVITKDLKGDSVTALKYVNGNTRVDAEIRSENRRRQVPQNNRASTIPRNMKLQTPKPQILVTQKTDTKKYVTRLEGVNINSSLPTIFLLKELEARDTKKPKENKINELGSILGKITPSPNQGNNSFLSPNVRNLSTVVTKKSTGVANASTKKSTGVANASTKSSKDTKESVANKDGEKPCPKIGKCPSFLLKNCPMKEDRTCTHQRPLVCCEKKPSPNQAFSECMDEEIKPFSNTSQWTCNKKEYGFEPNPKKLNEPLDSVKNKKFSTRAGDKPIVDYFTARYSTTNMGQSRKHDGNVIERLVKTSSGCRDPIQRDSSTLTDTMSDVTGCRPVRKDFMSMEQQRPKLLSQKSNYTVARVSCRTISTLDKVTEDSFTEPLQRGYSTDDKGNNHRSDCKFPKKKACPKFELDNCPAKERHSCTHKYIPPTTRRTEPPYPSFSQLVDDDIEDKLIECPMDKEKVEELQPHYMARYEKKEILPPIEPHQGRIDPKIEEQCIRERLCLKNEGLTQDCSNFGAYVKPLKSKNFFKQKNSDCEKIEKLKKMGKWPPNFTKKFSTCTSFTCQTRNMSSFTKTREQTGVGDLGSRSSKKFCVRTFHALCRKTQSSTTGEINKKPFQNHVVNVAAGLKNIQWRTDNFQKWHRLRKISNYPRLTQKYHSCSKLRHRRFVKRRKNSKTFTTCVGKARVVNLNLRGVVCSKLKHKKLEKHRQAPKHLSLSSVKTPVGNDSKQRTISTTKALDKTNKQKLIRFPLYPKPIKQASAYKMANAPNNMKRVDAGGERKKDKKDKKGNNKTWQPKYPGAPEVDTVAIPPYQSKAESSWEKECLIHFSGGGKKKTGKTWDCSAVEKPFIRLNSSDLEEDCLRQEAVPCITCGEVFMRHNPVQTKSYDRRKQAAKCPKLPNPCESRQLPDPPEYPEYPTLPDPCEYPPLPSPGPKKIKQSYRLCPDTPAPTLWEKIVNYFKAKPNCPGPDEWKKKALREKAQKAAKAAGLCLCEPDSPHCIPEKTSGRETNINSKDNCLPTRKGLYRTTTRHYSSGVNSWNTEELDKLMEEEKKKQLAKKPPRVVMEEPCHDEDVNQKCLDPLLENVFKQAILSRNSLSCLEKPTDLEPKDDCVKYSLNILPSDLNFLADCIKESSVEGAKFESKYVSDIQEYFSKIDSLTDINFEELEKAKTKNLVKELDKLLKQEQKPHKKS